MRKPCGNVMEISGPPKVGTPARGGAMAAELAILLPFISLMFLIAGDFCRVFYCSESVQNCAECAALYASGTVQPNSNVSATTAAQQAAVAEGTSLNPALQAQDVNVTIANGVATVTVTYQFQTIVSYPLLPDGITITRTVQMSVIPPPGQ
jgi:Flp pilus assembly protein TadG